MDSLMNPFAVGYQLVVGQSVKPKRFAKIFKEAEAN